MVFSTKEYFTGIATFIVALVPLVVSFHLPEATLNREARQANLSPASPGIALGLTQTINVDGQNLTLAGGLSGASGGFSVESEEFFGLNSNITAYIVNQLLGLNQSTILFGDRKKRQISSVLGQAIGMNGQIGGLVGLSNEALSGETSGQFFTSNNGTLSLVRPMLPGQPIDVMNGGLSGFLGDRKKRQVMLGQIPSLNMNGQIGGLVGLSNEALSGETSGQLLTNNNGTLSLVRPMLPGQPIDVMNGGVSGLLGDRKKRQVVLGMNGQIGGLIGLSNEAFSGETSGQILANNNGTLSLVRPMLPGQPIDVMNTGTWLLGDRKKRQVPLSQTPVQIPTFTVDIGGQNVTVAGGLSGLSMEASFGSGELVLNPNGTLSLLRPYLSGVPQSLGVNPAAAWLLGDRKKRQVVTPQGIQIQGSPLQVPTYTIDIGGQNVTVAGGLSGLSMEASFGSGELVMNPNGTLSVLRPYLSGVPQSLGVNPAAAWLLRDRKKRQVVTPQGIQIQGSPLQLPTYTIDIGGQNVTVAGGLSGLSMEASFGSGELVMNPNGTLSLLRPYLSGVPQSLGVNPAAAWLLGDRKKRQVVTPQGIQIQGSPLQLPTYTIDIGGQNVTVAGGLSGLSMEASFGSGELVMNPNGTLSLLRPYLSGVPQSLGVNPAAAWLLGDRKKRQVVTPQGIQIQGSPLQVPTYTIDIGGQNVTVAGGLSGLSMEASFGSGELVVNPNGTLSLLRPYLSGVPQSLGVNPAAAWLRGDRKKRQVVTPQGIQIQGSPLQVPTYTIDIGGQNVTVVGGLSGLSMEASFGSGELVMNPNGTLSVLRPYLSGVPQSLGVNPAAAWLLGDRKKRQVVTSQGIQIQGSPLQVPTYTIDIGGQNVTVAGSLSGLSMEASFGSGELVLNPNGTLSLLRPYLSGVPQSLGVNPAAAWLLGDRKKRQAATPLGTLGTLPFLSHTVDIGGQNVTFLGSLSMASFEGLSAEGGLFPQNGTLNLIRGLNLGQPIDLSQLQPNDLVNLLLLDRKRRQAKVTPEDLVLTAAALDAQSVTLLPREDGLGGDDIPGLGDIDGAVDERNCVCASQLCSSYASFIYVCRQIQSGSDCVAAMDELMIIECPDWS